MEKPYWEEPKFQPYSEQEKKTFNPMATNICSHETVKATKGHRAPLELFFNQVLNEDIRLASTDRSKFVAKNESMESLDRGAVTIPPRLANLKITQKLLNVIAAEYERLGAIVSCNKNGTPQPPRKIANDWIWASDFKEFEETLSQQVWEATPKSTAEFINSSAMVNAPLVSVDSYMFGANETLSFVDLLKAYLMAYYTGEYVDRRGNALAKPELNFPVKNEVVVAFASIFLDSLWDYVLYRSTNIHAPMVYEWHDADKKIVKYINATLKAPTFAKLLIAKKLAPDTDSSNQKIPPTLQGVLEKVKAPNTAGQGLTEREVCVVHYLSGLAGEASQALAGLIVRSLGGANLGFVVGYGKFSIGDNTTLVKLIDASVERFSAKSAELLFSDIFYGVSYNVTNDVYQFTKDSPKYPHLDQIWFAEHLKLADLLKCLEFDPAWVDKKLLAEYASLSGSQKELLKRQEQLLWQQEELKQILKNK